MPMSRTGGNPEVPPLRVKPMKTSGSLYKSVSALAAASALQLFLAEVGSKRLSVSQAAFFLLAAAADAKGTPMTTSQILEAAGEQLSDHIRTSYKVLLTQSRRQEPGLGWLDRVENPDDNREKLLVLTPAGRKIAQAAVLAMSEFPGLAS